MQAPLRYVAIGDSLSEGVGDDPWPDGTPRGWADRLAGRLAEQYGPDRQVEYANLAVRGLKAAQVRDTQLANAVAMEPDVVTLTAGMNDILRSRVDFEALRAALVGLVAPLTARGARVVIVPIPDVRRVSPVGGMLNARRLRLNDIYRELARHHGMEPVTDTAGTVFEDPRAWADDRLHLSPLGHQRLALAAAAGLGVPVDADALSPPDGDPPRRTVRAETTWVWQHVAPWVGRRLRGTSSGDGRTAKRPTLERFDSP
ncbi:SGNH/GDSL hydrolase family protein [Solicola gregarius]|uniref:SGNH/GDSL hydrolase family protein n=1 Tax=Solicola gregarius TaxID=2908642 RepID=A0AA46TKE5_9ACTN|nr:SGNH/GDSL hydrolase family protein [Solicola gregarius]UYM06053.1 SGNH/GDSL hydrolase family protein [Solicola gregarius]